MLHFLCSRSYLFKFLLSSRFYWHSCLKSTAYFFDPPCRHSSYEYMDTLTAGNWERWDGMCMQTYHKWNDNTEAENNMQKVSAVANWPAQRNRAVDRAWRSLWQTTVVERRSYYQLSCPMTVQFIKLWASTFLELSWKHVRRLICQSKIF